MAVSAIVRTVIPGLLATTTNVGFSGTPRITDDVPGLIAAYSLRLVNRYYTGPLVRIKRTSDGALQDFYPNMALGGFIDRAELLAFAPAEPDAWCCYYIYDQSGLGYTLTGDGYNGGTNGMPQVSWTAMGNGKPAFGGVNKSARNTGGPTITSMSFLMVTKDTAHAAVDAYFYFGNVGMAYYTAASGSALAGDYGLGTIPAPASTAQAMFISNGGASAAPTGIERWSGVLSVDHATLRKSGVETAMRFQVPKTVVTTGGSTNFATAPGSATNTHAGLWCSELLGFSTDLLAAAPTSATGRGLLRLADLEAIQKADFGL